MKFVIVGMHASGKQDIADILVNDYHMNLGRFFSNVEQKDLNDIYHGDMIDIYKSSEIDDIFENNAYIMMQENICHPKDDSKAYRYFTGISRYSYDNSDFIVVNPIQYASIPSSIINDNEACVVWIDNNYKYRQSYYSDSARLYNFYEQESDEKSYMESVIKLIYNRPNKALLYFNNEDPARIATIIYSIHKHNDLLDAYTKYFSE